MKNIILKKLELINFKGIKSLKIDFEEQTNIFGANGTGKTTVFDSFTWLLFGKDSTERKDFEVKTLDQFGKIIPKIEHEVNAVIEIEGEEISIRRILKENWVKKRGSLESEFAGNITDYYWNDVPMQQKDFQNKVGQILDETVFKLITSPLSFNSGSWGNTKEPMWKNRRNVLTQIVGEVSDAELADGNPEYEKLIANLTQGKTLEDYKAQVQASVKKAKDDLKLIPTRIDEVYRSKPEAQDFDSLELELKNYQIEIDKTDGEISNVNTAFQSKLDSQREAKVKANNIKSDIEIIEKTALKEAKDSLKIDTSVLDGLNSQLGNKQNELTSYLNASQTLSDKLSGLESQLKGVENKIKDKRDEWNVENAKEISFDDSNFCCPTCKRDFEASDVDAKKTELSQNFKNQKQSRLSSITQQGQSLSTEKTNIETEISTLKGRIENGKTTVETCKNELQEIKDKIELEKNKAVNLTDQPSEELIYESILSMNSDYKLKKEELKKVEDSIVEVPEVDNSELTKRRKSLVSEIDVIKYKLQSKTQIESANQRISQLEEEQVKLAQQVADVEKIQFVIENFIKDKIDRLETAINSKFKYVTFKMFEDQINGGMKETCEAMVNGVPFSDVNNAAKINAGLDVINTLSEFYGVSAPIFVDNAESVHTLIESESQLIRLVVSESHTKLMIESRELVA